MRVEILSRAFSIKGIPHPLVSHSPSKGKRSSGLCLCSSLWIVGFLVGLVSFLYFMVVCAFRTSLSLVALHHRCICALQLSPALSVDPWQLLFGVWFFDPRWLSRWKGCWVFCIWRGAIVGWACVIGSSLFVVWSLLLLGWGTVYLSVTCSRH